jgi:hypothetical protein
MQFLRGESLNSLLAVIAALKALRDPKAIILEAALLLLLRFRL